MKRVKVPGLDIQIPPGSAFKIETPKMMPKMHLLAAVVAPRGYGKGVITTNLIAHQKWHQNTKNYCRQNSTHRRRLQADV